MDETAAYIQLSIHQTAKYSWSKMASTKNVVGEWIFAALCTIKYQNYNNMK